MDSSSGKNDGGRGDPVPKKLKISDGELVSRISNLFSTGKLTKSTVGLGNVDNTSDLSKAISNPTQAALNAKVSTSTTVNGHALNQSAVSLVKSDFVGTVVSVTSSMTASAWETVVAASAASGPIVVTLPNMSASTSGQTLAVVKTDASANTVSVQPGAGATLNGATSSLALSNQWDACIIANDGSTKAYTLAKASSGGGGGGGIFPGPVGIGTNSPQAPLDVETSSTSASSSTVSSYGVSQCNVDEFGYASCVSAGGRQSISVSAHTISVGGTSYPIAQTNLTGLSTNSSIYYVYADGLSGSANVNTVPADFNIAPYQLPGAYLNFESGLDDPFWNAWSNGQQAAITLDSSKSKFGTTSCKIAGGDSLIMARKKKSVVESRQAIFLPACPFWQIDAWYYITNVSPATQSPMMTYRSSSTNTSTASGNGFGLYKTANLIVAYISTNNSDWNVANSYNCGTVPNNQWFQMGVRYDGVNFTVKVNGTLTTFASSAGLANFTASNNTYWTQFGPLIDQSASYSFNVDEIIMTPYLRPWAPSSAFVYTDNCLVGSPFAAYLTGTSGQVDGYNLKWFGNLVAGPNYPAGNASFALNDTTGRIWSPVCPNLNACSEWTIEAYIYVASVSASAYLINLTATNDEASLVLTLNSATQMQINIGTSTSFNIFQATFPITTATWFHCAITYSRKGGYVVYRDGVVAQQTPTNTPIAATGQIILGNSPGGGNAGHAFSAYMNCFRITPALVYTSSFTPPTGMLGLNAFRDVIDPSTGACITQGLNASTANKRVYLASARLDIQRVSHWIPRFTAAQPIAKLGQASVWRDGSITSPAKSYHLPAPFSNSKGFICILRADGKLFVGGDPAIGSDGALGVPVSAGTIDQFWPVPSQTIPFKTVISCWACYYCVDINNNVWACGYNGYGAFGDGTTTNRSTLSPIYFSAGGAAGPSLWLHVSSPSNLNTSSLFIVDAGNMYSCGSNGNGQLGLGTTSAQYTLTQVPKISGQNWAAAWQYGLLSFAITDAASGNKLYACGTNAGNSLGIAASGGTAITSFTQCINAAGQPMSNVKKVVSVCKNGVTNSVVYALLNDGRLYVTGHSPSSPYWAAGTGSQYNIPGFGFVGPICQNVADVAASGGGDDFGLLVLRTDGTLWTTGSQRGGFIIDSATGTISTSLQAATTGAIGERLLAESIFGCTYAGTGCNGAITFDGRALLGGALNTQTNALGGFPINSQVYTPVEISLDQERITSGLFFSTWDGTTNFGNTFLQTFTGKIYVAGAQAAALTGRAANKQTFAPLFFEPLS
ncbi:MAG: hypothetical protein E6Q06_01835 [Candidatus Moraniibacteriota bacterium]|nr:MAG: hypothetical protein E6Q06_01835 [Candidatus Moranbacteria bacterium]